MTPSKDAVITAATTYTYTYAAKEAATVTNAPTANALTYTDSAQTLVTDDTPSGGTMQYVLGADAATALTVVQYRRLMMHLVDKKTTREIAALEGVAQQVVSKSIIAARKKIFRRFFHSTRK